MLKKFSFIVLFLLYSFSSAYAANGDVSFSIRFYDKKVYFPDSEILIKGEIRNETADTFRFKAASERAYNLDFDVSTITNIRAEHADEFIIRRNTNQPVFYREVSLEPGEEYGFVIELKNFVKIPQAGVYVIKADFFPELFGGTQPRRISSNYLNLSVRPRSGVPEVEERIAEATGEILRQQAIPPDEVVTRTLTARQKSQWENFFLYLDVESIMRLNPDNDSRYRRLGDADRRAMVSRFRDQLKSEVVDEDIILIPDSFEIIKTSYTPSEATVEVIEKFAYSDYTEIKRFTYYLRRRDTVWTIYSYEVRNIGTE